MSWQTDHKEAMKYGSTAAAQEIAQLKDQVRQLKKKLEEKDE